MQNWITGRAELAQGVKDETPWAGMNGSMDGGVLVTYRLLGFYGKQQRHPVHEHSGAAKQTKQMLTLNAVWPRAGRHKVSPVSLCSHHSDYSVRVTRWSL